MIEIIGLTGPMGAGKSTASEILQTKGYAQFSFSDEVKKEATLRGLSIDERSDMQNIGDDLRKKFGLAVLAKRTVTAFRKSGKPQAVIEGIRNPGELKYLQDIGGFVIGVDSPFEQRLVRVIHRGNPYDPKTREEFEKSEQRDRGVGQESFGQQADECLKFSDIVIMNDTTPEEFRERLLAVITSL